MMLKCCVKDCTCEADYVINGFSLCENHIVEKPNYLTILAYMIAADNRLREGC